MPTHVAEFMVTIAVLAMLPGPNNATVTRQTLAGGRRAGLLTVAGTSTGIVVWAGAAAVGLSAVLLAQPAAYLTIRLGGAAILFGLGALSLWSLRTPPDAAGAQHAGRLAGGDRRSYAIGVASSVSNPKAGVVAVSLIPQFVTAHGPVLASSVALGALWATISGTWFCLYVWIVDRGHARMIRPAVTRNFQAVTGVSMVVLGIIVALGA